MKKIDISNPDWLQQIRTEHPATVLEVATEKLRQCSSKGSERLHWLFTVDNALNPIALALVNQFADARRLSAEDEINLWEAGRIYHDLQAVTLVALLREVAERSIPVSDAPAIVARTLYHRGMSALWRHLRYIPLPEGWWLETHKIFAFAEREQISTSEVTIGAEQPPTHAAALYLQLLLLDTPNRTNMTRQQVIALSQWLKNQTDAIPVERDFDNSSQVFYINLDEDRGGRRIRNFEQFLQNMQWRAILHMPACPGMPQIMPAKILDACSLQRLSPSMIIGPCYWLSPKSKHKGLVLSHLIQDRTDSILI